MVMQSINPATEEVLKEYQKDKDGVVDDKLARADLAYRHHRLTTFGERAELTLRVAELLERNKEDYARIITAEMGKTFKSAVAEVEKCAFNARFYAGNAESMLARVPVSTLYSESFIEYRPVGPVLAVMPWNFPFWQVFRFATPALMAGNVALLKHASNVPQCALLIEQIFKEAGFAEGCFQTLMIGSDKVERVIADNRVRAVTLTGSEGAGAKVAEAAGRNIKKTVLELGGSDAFLVMPSADLDDAVAKGVTGRIQNAGQSCIAAKRFIVHADIYDRFRDKLLEKFKALKTGDPMDEATDLGPLAMKQGVTDLDKQVQDSVKKGAIKAFGAQPVGGKGYFFQPGILETIPRDAPAYSEEFFGPVALLFKAPSLGDAIKLANATRFGLGSAVFTQERDEMEEAVRDLDAGFTAINTIVASDPRLPFGGVKSSGYGRELAAEGIREFCNIKTVVRA